MHTRIIVCINTQIGLFRHICLSGILLFIFIYIYANIYIYLHDHDLSIIYVETEKLRNCGSFGKNDSKT